MTVSGSAADADGYKLPPQTVVDIVNAQPEPSVIVSPDGRGMLLVEFDAMPDIADLARPMDALAGVRIDPLANTQFRSSYRKGLSYQPIDPATENGDRKNASPSIPLKIHAEGDAKPKIGFVKWSHNSQDFVFTVLTASGTALYCADVDSLTPKLVHPRISTVLNGLQWMPDGKHLIFSIVPENHDPPPPPSSPIGPRIQESSGDTSPTRTYQNLLKTPHDEDLFEFHATTEIVITNTSGDILQRWPRDMYADVSPAPDGDHMLVTRLKKPFSYLLTYQQFAMDVDVCSAAGDRISSIAAIPVANNIPIEGVRTQPRIIHWMSSRSASLCYTTALDGGDPNQAADFRDQVWTTEAPFSAAPTPLMKVQHRHYGMSYFADPSLMVTTEYDRDQRWIRNRLFDTDKSLIDSVLIVDRSIRDRYNDPGRVIQRCDSRGHYIVDRRDDIVFRAGAGASEGGNRPFLDRQNLKTLQTDRIWQCDDQSLEAVVKLLPSDSADHLTWLASHQTPVSPPNLMFRTNSPAQTTSAARPITHFGDPTPQIRGIKKEIVTYQRSDGVQLSATLHLPADYQPGQRLPLLVWAYPQEFNDPSTAGQVSGSAQRFTRIGGISHLTAVTQGYAVMDNATMPVIGDPETMNDTFIEQIVDAAQAAVDFAVQRGVADRQRTAVGGHSYGAFMTANLMAHSTIFQAGIARSGAYNRTLTPFGFQSERRSYWDAKHIYNSISPFMSADQIQRPLLIMHGEKDNNSGTFPLQSERLYQAIKGNGGTARLVVLPHESHGYIATQSVLHTQAEMIQWLDRHVKGIS
jgi:dipeptidyl aminopeptidase/acylaminoacyl peptidase